MSQGNKNETKKKYKEYSQNLEKGFDCHIENSIKVTYLNLNAAKKNLYRLL